MAGHKTTVESGMEVCIMLEFTVKFSKMLYFQHISDKMLGRGWSSAPKGSVFIADNHRVI